LLLFVEFDGNAVNEVCPEYKRDENVASPG
jgi:hypothetical protein